MLKDNDIWSFNEMSYLNCSTKNLEICKLFNVPHSQTHIKLFNKLFRISYNNTNKRKELEKVNHKTANNICKCVNFYQCFIRENWILNNLKLTRTQPQCSRIFKRRKLTKKKHIENNYKLEQFMLELFRKCKF